MGNCQIWVATETQCPRRREGLLVEKITESMSIYDVEVDPTASNTAHGAAVQMVGYGKRVLEFGCAAGHVTKVLVEQNCTVTGVERDATAASGASRYADRVVVGDIEADEVWSELEGHTFDVLMFGDVLEHMRDPLAVLRRGVPLLAGGGVVVTSIPNVAHGDLRMALLRGRFDYGPWGLLDRTHLRLFTHETMLDLLHQAGLAPVELRRIVVPLFSAPEFDVKPEDVDPQVVEMLRQDPNAETYQFVVKAIPDGGDEALRQAMARLRVLEDDAPQLSRQLAAVQSERDASFARAMVAESALTAVQAERDASDARATDAESALTAVHAERDASDARAMNAESALMAVHADRDAWRARAIDAENALMAANAELRGITGSRSLRWTAPARRLAREARRVIGGR
jgi:2-polyprenyl-3-methyl-5-hydroxy-6-metoxy-1,4-benzoquinol methylase